MIALEALLSLGKSTDSGCLEWTRAKSRAGYGQIRIKGKLHYVHRLVLQIAGVGTQGLHVLHRCDNPSCFRQEHLFLGTHAENMRDMKDKGRASNTRGERSGKAKISDAIVVEMFRRRKRGELLESIASDYGIHASHLSRVLSGKRWHGHARSLCILIEKGIV